MLIGGVLTPGRLTPGSLIAGTSTDGTLTEGTSTDGTCTGGTLTGGTLTSGSFGTSLPGVGAVEGGFVAPPLPLVGVPAAGDPPPTAGCCDRSGVRAPSRRAPPRSRRAARRRSSVVAVRSRVAEAATALARFGAEAAVIAGGESRLVGSRWPAAGSDADQQRGRARGARADRRGGAAEPGQHRCGAEATNADSATVRWPR